MKNAVPYRLVAEWYYKTTREFFDSFPWVKELTPAQRACHKVGQQLNVDCHNGYLSGIIQKMTRSEPYRLQHRAYHRISNQVHDDTPNRKSDQDIPKGVILRRLSSVIEGYGRDDHNPLGKTVNELSGTLFYKKPKKDQLQNLCVGTHREFKFWHPFYWEVPTVDQILKVMSFSTKTELDTLVGVYEAEVNGSPVVKAIEHGIEVFKEKTKKQPKKDHFESIPPTLRVAGTDLVWTGAEYKRV